MLVRGPELVRTGRSVGHTLALTGDTSAQTEVEVWAPASLGAITWNGRQVVTRPGSDGASVLGTLAGPKPVARPAVNRWRYHRGSPETKPGL